CPLLPPSALLTLSLHDALPIYFCSNAWCHRMGDRRVSFSPDGVCEQEMLAPAGSYGRRSAYNCCPMAGSCPRHVACQYTGTKGRSEEHTSALQSRFALVCRLLL